MNAGAEEYGCDAHKNERMNRLSVALCQDRSQIVVVMLCVVPKICKSKSLSEPRVSQFMHTLPIDDYAPVKLVWESQPEDPSLKSPSPEEKIRSDRDRQNA